MRILFTLFEIQDWGGIVADLELKCRGLVEAGHKVDLLILKPNAQPVKMRKPRDPKGPEGSYPSAFGNNALANTHQGWYNVRTMGYASKQNIQEWFRIAEKYDGIFHEIPNPPIKLENKKLDTKGYWKKIFDTDTPQIIIAHDAHFREMYPQIIEIAHRIKGIATTNHAGYAGLSWFPAPRAFIGAPHPVLNWKKMRPWDERKPRAVAAHMWKAWKHQDYLVRCSPLLKKSFMHMAGSGIEYHYMTSENKRPPEYVGMWEAAVDSGRFKYHGLLVPDALFKLYQNSRVMADMSFNAKFNKLGNHFNRSIIEGYNNGVVPICTAMNMKENNPQIELFKGGRTHIEVAHDISPKELAKVIDATANMHADDAAEYIDLGRKMLLRFFDYRVASLEFLKLLKGKPAGVYPKLEIGKTNPIIEAASDLIQTGVGSVSVKALINRMEKEAATKKSTKVKKSLYD